MRWMIGLWVAFFAGFVAGHLRVRRARGGGSTRENRVRRERSSDLGMALQFSGMLLAWFWRGPFRADLLPVAFVTGAICVVLAWWALFTLGRHWRVQAVVTDDHELITSGPYSWVRHPVYTAFLGMVASWAMVACPLGVFATACGLFIAGTEIRIAAEDRILGEAFPRQFPEYRRSVSAYVPWLR